MWRKWKKKSKNVPDERIARESNKLAAKLYYVLIALTVVVLTVKIILKQPVFVYGLELIALVASVLYIIIAKTKKGILGIRQKDEALLSLHEEILGKGMMIVFNIYVFGECIFMFVFQEYIFWLCSYILIWFVPALIYTIASIKKGWFIWGSKKRETEGKKNFKLRVVVGALIYGLIMGMEFLFKDGTFHPEGILWVLGMAALWGIPFYLIMMLLMKVSEKKADKNVEEKENAIEE